MSTNCRIHGKSRTRKCSDGGWYAEICWQRLPDLWLVLTDIGSWAAEASAREPCCCSTSHSAAFGATAARIELAAEVTDDLMFTSSWVGLCGPCWSLWCSRCIYSNRFGGEALPSSLIGNRICWQRCRSLCRMSFCSKQGLALYFWLRWGVGWCKAWGVVQQLCPKAAYSQRCGRVGQEWQRPNWQNAENGMGIIWNRFRFWQISFPVLVQCISWLCPRPDWTHFARKNVWPINSPGIFDIMIHVDPPPKPSEYFLRSLGFWTLFPDRMYMLEFYIFSSFRVTSVEEL